MDFNSMHLLDNFSAVTSVPPRQRKPGYVFHQLGLIYAVEGLAPLEAYGSLPYEWVDATSLIREKTAPLAWQALTKAF
jgi:hypothetical protein